MGLFKYKAKENSGNTVEGVVEAGSSEDAFEKINQLGYVPVKIEETNATQAREKPRIEAKPKVKIHEEPRKVSTGRIKGQNITEFSRELASLIRSGVPILRAINIIAEQNENTHFKVLLRKIHEDIKAGKSLSNSLGEYPRLFPPLYLALIQAGEASGTLDQTLTKVTEYRQKQEALAGRLKTAMIYPALMGLTGVGTIVFMLAFVLPRLTTIFETMGGALPVPTQIVIRASEALRQEVTWGVIAVIAVIVLIIGRRQSKNKSVAVSALALQVSVFGPLILKAEIAKLSRTLELLVKSGVPVLEAIDKAGPVLSNLVLRNEITRCRQELTEGGTLGKGLKRSKRFPVFMTNLISVGEESGRLDEALGEIGNFYERETDEALRAMTALIEPLMILGMGLVIGFIVIAMLLPMFELNMMVH